MPAIITYRPNAQKTPGYFDRVLNKKILEDICFRLTGQKKYRVIRETSGYNHGRLLFLEYKGVKYYISLSEDVIKSRNQSIQSVPTAINLFYADTTPQKQLCYYFLPHTGNAFTSYHLFIYRLMLSARVRFLNFDTYSPSPILPYGSVDEIIDDRNNNRNANASNNSSFVSRGSAGIQIYAKTFGANKYESTLLGVAVAVLADQPVEVFNICEQDLDELPASSKQTLSLL